MLEKVKREVVTLLARVRIRSEEEVAAMEAAERMQAQAQAGQMQFQHADADGLGADEEAQQAQAMAAALQYNLTKVGRNDPCPWGRGKKLKHDHGPQHGEAQVRDQRTKEG